MTFWVAGAVVVGAGINAAAGSKAVKSQKESLGEANVESARQYDLTRADTLALLERQRQDQQPWMDAGRASLAELASGMAPNGRFTKRFTLADFAADPGYQFRLQEGLRGVTNSAASRGMMGSGATLKALMRYNSGLADQEFSDAYTRFNNDQNTQVSRLQSLAGIGQSATNVVGQQGTNAYGQIAGAGQNYSNNVQSNLAAMGNARASGYVGGANAITGGISQYMNYTQNQNLLRTLQDRPPTPARGWTGYDFADTRISNMA